MYTLGHVGTALLVYAPVAGTLSVTGYTQLAGIGLLVAAGFSMVPDIDTGLPIQHRGLTHTIWFAVGVSVASFAVLSLLTNWDGVLVGFVALTVLLSTLTHLLADSITPMGITPFAPLWDWHHSFEFVYAKDIQANLTLFWLGIVATVVVATPKLV